jgi:hypothetical protein
VYSEILNVDHQHREAAVAAERAGLELQPRLDERFSYFYQNGRNGLALIARIRYDNSVILPYRDEDEFVQFGYSRVLYEPPGDPTLPGNIYTVRTQYKPVPNLLLYAQANDEVYENRFSDRVTFDTGVRWEPWDLTRLRLSGFLENLVENGETLRQNIYRGGVRLGGDVRPTRRWDLGGDYEVAVYSDKNSANFARLYNEVLLTYLPDQLKAVANLQLWGFQHTTEPENFDPNNIHGLIHPYFSPHHYAYGEGRLEYVHYFSRDYFAHANTIWVGLQYAIGWDNNFNNYHTLRALGNYDVRSWLSVGFDVQGVMSPVYNVASVMG